MKTPKRYRVTYRYTEKGSYDTKTSVLLVMATSEDDAKGKFSQHVLENLPERCTTTIQKIELDDRSWK